MQKTKHSKVVLHSPKSYEKSELQINEHVRKESRKRLAALATWKPPADIQQLFVFSIALKDIAEAIGAVINQPRAEPCNPVLEDWHQSFSGLSQEIVNKVARMRPGTDREAEWKAQILIDWEMRCGLDDPPRTAIVIGKLMQELRDIEHQNRRASHLSRIG